eukprot:TRINITY_DN61667_c0_g1_i1.p1 TRINITY_DN61667_c0_g1~~TRINITY_DN61667_c0_g1_i1.p1  ORF type:complete len:655 (+),score=91.74 TRINITY_DN61667_c0_g1_i1:145-2109(+)
MRAIPINNTSALAAVGIVGVAYYGTRRWFRPKPKVASRPVDVEVKWGTDAHVVEIHITFSKPTEILPSISVDVFGPAVPGIASMFLPLTTTSRHLFVKKDSNKVTLGLGWRINRDTIADQLTKFAKSNQIFIVELLGRGDGLNPSSLCVVPMRPGSVLAELRGDTGRTKNDIERITAPELDSAVSYRRDEAGLAGSLLRFMVCPTVDVIGAWALCLHTSVVLEHVPPFPGLGCLAQAPNLRDILPPMPSNFLAAFDLGVLVQRLREIGPGANPAKDALLASATKIVGRVVTEADLEALREELVRAVARQSLFQRVSGLFSFVNLMWLAATLGITVSVGPVLWLFSAPLRKVLARLGGKVKAALLWLLEHIVLPIIVRLHKIGVFEIVAHGIAFSLTAQAARLRPESRTVVAIAGLIATSAAIMYSVALLYEPCGVHRFQKALKTEAPWLAKAQPTIIHVFLGLLLAPTTILHQSTLLGYATVGILLSALGSFLTVMPFGYIVGFHDGCAMMRSAIVCGLGVACFGALRAWSVDSFYLGPFVSGVSVLGGIGHYLALLIRSNYWYRRARYFRYNMLMLGSLVLGVAVGRVFGMPGLANTATTFFALWLLEKNIELKNMGVNVMVIVFGSSVAMYYSAVWLHTHPKFVVSLFHSMQ